MDGKILSLNIPNYNYNRQYPSFTGINAASEKGMQKCEYALRIIGNKLADTFETKTVKAITKNISEVKPESTEKYLNQLEEISRFYSTGRFIDVNIEDKYLEQVAKDGKSTIFIMNHSNQTQDPSMLAVLSTLLTKAYRATDNNSDFPLPKIILNQDILTTMNPVKRKAFEAFGAVGVDANIETADKAVNARAFLPLIKDFVRNKCNIFIFPEGKLAVRKDLDLETRFQKGIAELINKVLGIKKEVQVVPVGFAYGKEKKTKFNAMEIGTPVIFTRQGENTTVSAGSIPKSEFAFDGFKKFFEKHKDETDVVITENGIPVKPDSVTDFIKSLLSENLNICSLEAQKKLPKEIKPDDTIILY